MDKETIIKIGGIYNIGFFVFHVFFWKLFAWKKELSRLTPINSAIMQVLNLCLMFCFLIFGYLSLFRASELTATVLGRDLLLLIALFWLARAIEQLVFFGRSPISIAMFLLFLLGCGLYAHSYVWT